MTTRKKLGAGLIVLLILWALTLIAWVYHKATGNNTTKGVVKQSVDVAAMLFLPVTLIVGGIAIAPVGGPVTMVIGVAMIVTGVAIAAYNFWQYYQMTNGTIDPGSIQVGTE